MLYTNLKHIENTAELHRIIGETLFGVIVCGRMDTTSIEAYRVAEELRSDFPQVAFFDLEYDNPEVYVDRVCSSGSLPYCILLKSGQVAAIIAGSHSAMELREQINETFFANK